MRFKCTRQPAALRAQRALMWRGFDAPSRVMRHNLLWLADFVLKCKSGPGVHPRAGRCGGTNSLSVTGEPFLSSGAVNAGQLLLGKQALLGAVVSALLPSHNSSQTAKTLRKKPKLHTILLSPEKESTGVKLYPTRNLQLRHWRI